MDWLSIRSRVRERSSQRLAAAQPCPRVPGLESRLESSFGLRAASLPARVRQAACHQVLVSLESGVRFAWRLLRKPYLCGLLRSRIWQESALVKWSDNQTSYKTALAPCQGP